MSSTRSEVRDLKVHAYVVLGMLRLGARSGYDIKQLIDLAGRHFWTISYPQIYPELDLLQELGYVRGKDDKTTGRKRRLYKITRTGERELDRWLRNREQPSLEIRDVGLLKTFVASTADEAREQLALMRKRSEDTIAHLEARARPTASAIEDEGNPLPVLTVEFGTELHRAIVRTCKKLERRLDA